MFEQTNQTQADDAASEAAFSSEAFESGMQMPAQNQAGDDTKENTEPAEDTAQTDAEMRYTVKYNGEEYDLTLDELKTRAQKGMNYDHVKAAYDRLKNSDLFKTLDRMARKAGVTPEEYTRQLEAKGRENRLAALRASGMREQDAQRFVSMEEKMERQSAEQDTQRPYLEFVRKFPDVQPEDIPPQVWERFHETGDLIGAYTEAENRKLKEQIRIFEQNKKNAETSIGSLANDRAVPHTDAFLEGLFG